MATPSLFDRLQGEPDAHAEATGRSMADVLALPDPLRQVVRWMMGQDEVSAASVAAQLGQDEATARVTLAELVQRRFVREIEIDGALRYRVCLVARRRGSASSSIWRALDEKTEE